MTGKRRGEFRFWNQVWALWYARSKYFSRIDTSDESYNFASTYEVDEFCRRRNV